jgi:hypothetical protein
MNHVLVYSLFCSFLKDIDIDEFFFFLNVGTLCIRE